MNRNKARGTAYETAVVDYLQTHGFPYAERRALRGNKDCGDIAGIPGLMIEIKAVRQITLAEFANEVAAQVKNAGARLGVAIIKRRQKPVSESYVVMTLDAFAALIRDDETTEGVA